MHLWGPGSHPEPPETDLTGHRLRFHATTCGPALVAQGIEHRFPKPGVAGSNPAGGTEREARATGRIHDPPRPFRSNPAGGTESNLRNLRIP
jgi:hypothetical protein